MEFDNSFHKINWKERNNFVRNVNSASYRGFWNADWWQLAILLEYKLQRHESATAFRNNSETHPCKTAEQKRQRQQNNATNYRRQKAHLSIWNKPSICILLPSTTRFNWSISSSIVFWKTSTFQKLKSIVSFRKRRRRQERCFLFTNIAIVMLNVMCQPWFEKTPLGKEPIDPFHVWECSQTGGQNKENFGSCETILLFCTPVWLHSHRRERGL